MHQLRIKFYDNGTWTDDPTKPCFQVKKNDERDVARHFGLYIVNVGRGEIVHDYRDDYVIPENPTLEDLDLHNVTKKALETNGINTLSELTVLTQTEVLNLKGIGIAKLNEIEDALSLINQNLGNRL